MSQITSEEVNYLVYRYLQEAGFVHSSFTFGQESFITRSEIKPSAVPPGMLVALLQKGLQYSSLEFHLNEDGTEKECARPWSLLDPHVCEEPPKAKPAKAGRRAADSGLISIEEAMLGIKAASTATKKRKKDTNSNNNNNNSSSNKQRNKSHVDVVGDEDSSSSSSSSSSTGSPTSKVARFLDADVITLTGHQSEVISCAWNPNKDLGILASVAGDDTGRLWALDPHGRLEPEQIIGHEVVLSHQHGEGQSKEITTLDWSPDGEWLVTGCYDGKASVWTRAGELKTTLVHFKGPIFALKWSPSGRYIAGAGLDHCAVVWDMAGPTDAPTRLFQNHTSPTMDLDWKDDDTFATCTTDKAIHIYSLSQPGAIITLSGHEDEINSVKWSPDGLLIASCSDDATACIWSPYQEGSQLLHTLHGHQKEIYSLKWAPTGPGSANPHAQPLLATASFDNTVRLWDPLTGTCLHVLKRHSDPVYAIAFSPDGRFLASGSLDETLNVWSVESGALVRTYDSGRGGIFELDWNPSGDRLAACTSDSTVCVFDFRP